MDRLLLMLGLNDRISRGSSGMQARANSLAEYVLSHQDQLVDGKQRLALAIVQNAIQRDPRPEAVPQNVRADVHNDFWTSLTEDGYILYEGQLARANIKGLVPILPKAQPKEPLAHRPEPQPRQEVREEASRAPTKEPSEMTTTEAAAPGDPRKVFVIHGKNADARRAMFDFLRALQLDPIEWSQAVAWTGTGAPYIGQVLDVAFAKARAVVALLTGDDEARLQTEFLGKGESPEPLTPQARPNVLFEAGMAMGRHPERTIFVELGKLRPFSDIGGRHVLRFDASMASRQDLAHRLKTAGCSVDMTGTDWHDAGTFPKISSS